MGRYRSLSRSLSPRRSRSPPRRKRYDDPRVQRPQRHLRSPAPSGLLVRNVSLITRPEDLRIPFERYGPVKDVYMPKNYYTGEPRGFAFVKFRYPEDALEAKEQLNHKVIDGREIRIVFAEENRKTPQEMQRTSKTSGRTRGSYRRRTPSRSPRRQYRSYSRSASPARRYSRSISHSSSPHRQSLKKTSDRARRYRYSSRSQSPRENAAHDYDHKLLRSGLREKLVLAEDERRSQRSPHLREFSPYVAHNKLERRSLTPGRSSPHDANTSKGRPVSREFSPHIERKGKSFEQAPSLTNGRSVSRSPS